MKDKNADPQPLDARSSTMGDRTKVHAKLPWEPPKLEDVSEQVMAQPYIRFT